MSRARRSIATKDSREVGWYQVCRLLSRLAAGRTRMPLAKRWCVFFSCDAWAKHRSQRTVQCYARLVFIWVAFTFKLCLSIDQKRPSLQKVLLLRTKIKPRSESYCLDSPCTLASRSCDWVSYEVGFSEGKMFFLFSLFPFLERCASVELWPNVDAPEQMCRERAHYTET